MTKIEGTCFFTKAQRLNVLGQPLPNLLYIIWWTILHLSMTRSSILLWHSIQVFPVRHKQARLLHFTRTIFTVTLKFPNRNLLAFLVLTITSQREIIFVIQFNWSDPGSHENRNSFKIVKLHNSNYMIVKLQKYIYTFSIK